MNLVIITGILLAALGAFTVVKGVSVQSKGTGSFGPIYSTVHEQHAVPAVMGWVAMVGGVLVIVAGLPRTR